MVQYPETKHLLFYNLFKIFRLFFRAKITLLFQLKVPLSLFSHEDRKITITRGFAHLKVWNLIPCVDYLLISD